MIIKDLVEGSSGIIDDFFRADNECNDVVIDVDSFWRVMGEPTVFSQGSSRVSETLVRDEPPFRPGTLLDYVREIKDDVKVENNSDWIASDSKVQNGLHKRKSCETPMKNECIIDLVTDKKPRLCETPKKNEWIVDLVTDKKPRLCETPIKNECIVDLVTDKKPRLCETPIKNECIVDLVTEKREIIHIPEMEQKVPKMEPKMEPKVPMLEHSVLNIIDDDDDDDSDVCILEDNDDGSDVCILEDMSSPIRPITPSVSDRKFVGAVQFPTSNPPINQTGVGCSRDSKNDERAKLQEAVEDLQQPEKEATPPDGLMAVPLMKHQRIALAWMVDQETKSLCCSGGILADDQGLGKTISTIALILTERSPSSKSPKPNKEKTEVNMLNLDDDDGGVYHLKNGPQVKGKPPAGTLIVCPTSVLRQWSEELVNKVNPKANLSVLVYYGTNRTKDPLELAKYDVVVTTYALVSMEVTQEPAVNEKDDPIGTPFSGFKKKKRKVNLPQVNKALDDEIRRDIKTGPLSKVAWFRVVLDETQCIKNHRTISARTCWGLRAKRRWCLSGTPIQNAIDDLYSYFRFVKHNPFADFKTFCEQIKAPIFYDPEDGFKRLQVVLKTFLLRRTKSTLIDGKPIIIIPPKTIELIRIEFSKEERDFYIRLEEDARAQFQQYAKHGTLKENYANILVMLLRLRQACDHPRLVNWGKFNTRFETATETARKLPREKQTSLLNCLEASSSICGKCSDSPEEAVVTVCGHVFCHLCILDLMFGDETQCPDKGCKTNLTKALVFSKDALRSAMLNPGFDGILIPDAESLDPRPPVFPESSSKIKATLKLLLSIVKGRVSRGCDSLSLVPKKEEPKKEEPKKEEPVGGFVTGKVLVFSQWTRMLDLLEASLNDYSIQYRRLDGRMPICARDVAVKEFNTIPQVNVMLMSLKAASLGLNMVAANHVIILDLWWNPTTEDQAIDRAHRIGQTRPVSVYRLAVKETVEDRILALQEKKRMMVAAAFGEEGQGGGESTRLTIEDLSFLFKVPLKKGKKKKTQP